MICGLSIRNSRRYAISIGRKTIWQPCVKLGLSRPNRFGLLSKLLVPDQQIPGSCFPQQAIEGKIGPYAAGLATFIRCRAPLIGTNATPSRRHIGPRRFAARAVRCELP